ncbi:hypothetical protein TSUD_73500 [Trifolium subterraneum]|uniref:Leucine-rich repeat-containing N-terminal plant-type domain-containing protein n=1 Tax=Trifolium subterraneum TaxID=3900 RepID=A0A2Z6LKF5_TRISU|nr:hypothetical protein TSUD_73500 [Trifolium subterraneum]
MYITCERSRVTSIKLPSKNLQGSLPKELVKLTALQHFECQGNGLTGPFPYLSKSLQSLIIHDNKFTSIPSNFFAGMGNLQEINMDDNPSLYPWQIPNSLRDCVALQNFSAHNAGIVGTIPDFFGRDGPLTGLVFLELSSNHLGGVLPASLSRGSIEFLLVNGQNMTGTLDVLQNMTSLKKIWVNDNSFTGPIPDVSGLKQLSDINLRDNQLTGVVPSSLVNLPNLQVVKLTNNYLQGSPPMFRVGVVVDNNLVGSRNQFCTNVPGQPCSPLVNALLLAIEPLSYPLQFAESWRGNDPCVNKWTGIICAGGNISVINFQNMGLIGHISPNFVSLSSLTKLLLANNSLTGTIPNQLTSMPLLQELDVSNNHLYGRVPSFPKGVVLKLGGNPDIGKDKPSSTSGDNFGFGGSGNFKTNGGGVIIGIILGIVILLCIGALVVIKFGKRLRIHRGIGKHPPPDAIKVQDKYQWDGNDVKVIIDHTIEVDEETYASINTVAELAGHCSAREPHQRPDMSHAVNVLSSLVEVWKPAEQNVDDIYGINFDMTLPEALQRWQAFEGRSTLDLTLSPSPMQTTGDNSHTSESPNVSSDARK